MDSLQLSLPAAEIRRGAKRQSFISRKDFRMTESVQAYRYASMRTIPKGGRVDQGTVGAIDKWLSSGDFRLEFYSSNDAGELRVRIVPSDSRGTTMDMSLQAFISIAPVTI